MQTAEKRNEFLYTAPAPRKRVVKIEGNVAYISKKPERQKPLSKNDAAPQRKRAIHEDTNAAVRLKKKIQEEAARKEAKKTRAKAASTLFVVFVAFCALVLLISRYAAICSIGSENNKLQSGIDKVETKIEELKANMELSDDLERIQDVAINEFGMKYPDQSQKVPLDMD